MSEPVFEHHGEGSDSVDSVGQNGQEPSSQPDNFAQESTGSEFPAAWAPILDKLPPEFHNQIAPELKKWDQGVNAQFQKYAPYKSLIEQGVDPEQIRASVGIYQNLNSDPVAFLGTLRDHLIEQGLYQEAAQVQDEIDEVDDDDDIDDPLARELAELKAWKEEFTGSLSEQIEQQQQEVLNQQARQSVQEEFKAIEDKVGPLPTKFRVAVAEKAMAMGQQQNRQVPLAEAYTSLMEVISEVRGTSAPRVVPSGGGLPGAPQVDLGNSEQRIAAAEEIARRMSGQ